MMTRRITLLIGMILLSLVISACNGGAAPEPEATAGGSNDAVAESVSQTIVAIAVAETVDALTDSGVAATPEPPDTTNDLPATEPAPTTGGSNDAVAESVSQTIAAIAVAETVDAQANSGVAATPEPPDTTNDLPATETAPTPTQAPPDTTNVLPSVTPSPTPTQIVRQPPNVANDIPGGQCERTDNISTRVQEDPNFLYRVYALDNRVGTNDGDGIVGVRFTIFNDSGQVYFREERTAGYCIFGGGEPDCNVWPSDEQGVFTWGAGGPIVYPGVYGVFIEVEAESADPATESNVCNWNFDMTVTLP
jgi:hypothetical protein